MGTTTATLARAPRARTRSHLVLVDDHLVQAALHDIREILLRTVSKAMEEVGSYVLDRFYDNDLALYHSSSSTKHTSLQKLTERCETLDFPVSRAFLSKAVRLAAYTRRLPPAAKFRLLPDSHRLELLRVEDPKKVEDLATVIIENRLPVRKVRELALHAAPKRATETGRKPTPEVLRALGVVMRALESEAGASLFDRNDIVALSGPQITEAQRRVRTATARLSALSKLLR